MYMYVFTCMYVPVCMYMCTSAKTHAMELHLNCLFCYFTTSR